MTGEVIMTVLDKKSVKTFANKQQEIKFKGADPDYLVYQKKKGDPYIFFATKKGMQEYLQTSLEEEGKKISKEVLNIRVGESLMLEDGSIWIRLKR